jgi:predicted site-specific integrase-resolvase
MTSKRSPDRNTRHLDRNLDRMLRRRDAAELLAVSTRTLDRWRVEGIGPPFARLNGRIRYPRQALARFIAERMTEDAP